MLKQSIIYFALVILFLMSSCKTKQPHEIALEFLNALNSSDYEKAKTICDEETKAYVEAQQSNMDALDDTIAENYAKAVVEIIGSPQQQGDTIIYNYKSSNIPSQRKIMLIKKNKNWLVHNTYEEEILYAPIGVPTYSEETIPLEGEVENEANPTEY